jgi:hypothetical protein
MLVQKRSRKAGAGWHLLAAGMVILILYGGGSLGLTMAPMQTPSTRPSHRATPRKSSVPMPKRSNQEWCTIRLEVYWFTHDVPDSQIGQITVSWSVDQAGSGTQRMPGPGIHYDANMRVWSLAKKMHVQELPYDCHSEALLYAEGPGKMTCRIVVGNKYVADPGEHPKCVLPAS